MHFFFFVILEVRKFKTELLTLMSGEDLLAVSPHGRRNEEQVSKLVRGGISIFLKRLNPLKERTDLMSSLSLSQYYHSGIT